MNNITDPRYPIGKFEPRESYSSSEIQSFIERIESLPSRVEELVKSFTEKKYNTPYREGGWTARQVLHHLPDSHLNAYIRTKWTLTEESPVIKAYDEKAWAQTPETLLDPVISINLLKSLHIKWVALLKSLSEQDRQRYFVHPETQQQIKIQRIIASYAWHGDHHLGHLKIVAQQ
jgi:hypothetical protein